MKNPNIYEDNHTKFFWRKCQICGYNYNVIGKMETFYEDSEFIFEKFGFNASLYEMGNVSAGPSTIEFARNLFSKLPKSLTLELYEMYRLDFELFDYDPHIFT